MNFSPYLGPIYLDGDSNRKWRDASGIGDERNGVTAFFRRGMSEHDLQCLGERSGKGRTKLLTICALRVMVLNGVSVHEPRLRGRTYLDLISAASVPH